MAHFCARIMGMPSKQCFFARKSASSQKNRTISLRGWLKVIGRSLLRNSVEFNDAADGALAHWTEVIRSVGMHTAVL